MGMAMNELVSRQHKIIGRILIGFIAVVIFAGAVVSYERFFIYQDFPVTVEAECDPASENCFVYYCDPEYEECTGDPEEDTWYYKRITKQGNRFPVCESGECPDVSCTETESGCEVEFCDPEGEEECSDQEAFLPIDADSEAPIDESASESEGDTGEESTSDGETEESAGAEN